MTLIEKQTAAAENKTAAEKKKERARAELRGDRILRFPEVEVKVNRPRSSIYLLISQGRFPAPVKIGARAVGWRESVIDGWLASLD